MSLISLLIALAAERYLSSPFWQFKNYYQYYLKFLTKFNFLDKSWKSLTSILAVLIFPVIAVYFVLDIVDDGFLHLVISTIVLTVCFGSFATRDTYKNYLMAAFRGEITSCELHHAQLRQDKNLPDIGFGQTLIWLNYRYYVAILLFFVFFGAPGAVFYRLLTTLIEKQCIDGGCDLQNNEANLNESKESNNNKTEGKSQLSSSQAQGPAIASEKLNPDEDDNVESVSDRSTDNENHAPLKDIPTVMTHDVYQGLRKIRFVIDWAPVRVTSFGYMLVGHFSKALPAWLENLFDVHKPAHLILADVAQKSEDTMIDVDDCTAEPCLLVRLAKRNLLLTLAMVALLTLAGIVS